MTLASTPSPSPVVPRITLIDTLRGVALLAMASYHFTWDLEFFGYLEPGTATQGWWKIYARGIASSFLFLAGISLVLAHYPAIRWNSFWKRFAIVAGAAVAISIATLAAVPTAWIFFGILHCIAASSLVGLAFVRRSPLIPGVAAASIILLMILDTRLAPGSLGFAAFDPRYLSWTGFSETPPRSNDFVPLFPWLAAFLAGMAIAGSAMRRGWLIPLSRVQVRPNLLSRAGRHSLLIYLLHQPLLIGVVYVLSIANPPAQPDPREAYLQACQSGCVESGHEPGICQSYCGCTAEGLQAQSLIEPLQSGAVDAQSDERVRGIAEECSLRSQ